MILIDSATGSIDLPKIFPKELVVIVDGLPSDIVIPGKGEGGKRITVGIEFKRIANYKSAKGSDVLKCIIDGRFAGTQLPRMLREHEEVWLIVEGGKRRGIGGELQVKTQWSKGRWQNASIGSRNFSFQDLEKWLITMQTRTPLKIKETADRLETKEWVMAMHEWWVEKGWEKHHSHDVTDKSRNVAVILGETKVQRMNREIAERLPGVGYEKAKRAIRKFGSTFDMVTAEEKEWEEIEGIGKKMAKRIIEAIHGYEHE